MVRLQTDGGGKMTCLPRLTLPQLMAVQSRALWGGQNVERLTWQGEQNVEHRAWPEGPAAESRVWPGLVTSENSAWPGGTALKSWAWRGGTASKSWANSGCATSGRSWRMGAATGLRLGRRWWQRQRPLRLVGPRKGQDCLFVALVLLMVFY